MKIDITKWTEKIKEINEGKTRKFAIMTMGCQLNENDSEKICGMVKEAGYELTEDLSKANLIIFNTCCVRENAESKLFGKLGEVKKYKENNGTIIATGGCMMQEKHIVEKLNTSYQFVDIIFGPHTLEKFPQDLYNALVENKKIEDILDIDGVIYEGIPTYREDKIKASVPIMNGCNNFCTYCIVPYVRGRERSRNPQDIINEVESLARQGYKEITLLGQNVNSYLVSQKEKGEDVNFRVVLSNVKKCNENENKDDMLESNIIENTKESSTIEMIVNSFATLLKALDKIEGIERIRFISPHPKDFTDDVIEAIANSRHICKLIHLPLQSGSSKVLKIMNRKYTKEDYLKLAEKIRNKVPNVTFSTDIIVGFPGEDEDDFEDTLDVVKKVKFEQIYMFIYSRRVGTPADKMENQVPEEIKHKRFERLKKLAEELIEEKNKEYVGTYQKVLVEGTSKTNSSLLTGRTESNKVVNFEGNPELIGKIVNLKIISQHIWYLKGKCDKM